MVTSQKMIESEMGDRGSKSVYTTVKEQRVDGSWYGNACLRCTLTDFERNNRIKNLSNQINIKRYYFTNNTLEKLNP